MTLASSLHDSLPAMPTVRQTDEPHNANREVICKWPQLQDSASM